MPVMDGFEARRIRESVHRSSYALLVDEMERSRHPAKLCNPHEANRRFLRRRYTFPLNLPFPPADHQNSDQSGCGFG